METPSVAVQWMAMERNTSETPKKQKYILNTQYCCKGDQVFQWEMRNFDPPYTSNP